jgi:vacuolar protein sorting-associated protein 54
MTGAVRNTASMVRVEVFRFHAVNSLKIAISTVLNNPHKQQAPPKAHSSLPPIVPAELPRVRRKDFDSYLRAVAPEWSRFQRHTISGHAVAAPLNDHVSSNTPPPSEPPTPRTTHLPNVTRPIPPLALVPSVFFDRNFNLGDPRTFDSVTEQNPDPDLAVDPSSPTHSTPLLEKFSQYADTVEQHLVQEISLRSTSFFAALTNLRELQLESEQCVSRIGILRTLLQEVDENGAKRGLEIVWKESRLRNLNAVREGVGGLSGVVEMAGVAKTLVSGGQWNEALGVIGDLEALWSVNHGHLPPKVNVSPLDSRMRNAGSSPLPPASEYEITRVASSQTIPLSTLRAFAALPTHLRKLTMEITASLTSELVNILRLDLVERINGTREPSSHASDDINQSLQDRLRPVLNGLTRTKGIREATLSWGEAVMEEVRATLKQVSLWLGSLAYMNFNYCHQRVSMLGGPVSVSSGSELRCGHSCIPTFLSSTQMLARICPLNFELCPTQISFLSSKEYTVPF